jgi:tetratricopeptide (TPR) repeat protein
MAEPPCQDVLETTVDSADASEPQAQPCAVAENQQQDETPNRPPSSTTTTTTATATKEDWEIERDHAKELGDQAFRMGGYRTAIDHYSHAIELDPDFVVAYSNRSAAYLKNNEKSKALHDAERVTDLDPRLSKGWSRRAAALHALKRWPHALEAYQKVLELDVTNAVAQKGLVECQTELDKAEAQRKRFDDEETLKEGVLAEVVVPPNDECPNEEAKEDDEEEEDDLLNGFFEEVEEVTKKKEPEPEVATNKVKNEKETLGSAQEQMDRLLQANYEWRNLNPYYVLQLPHVSPVCPDVERSERMHRTHRPSLLL